eukprot:UN13221
MDQKWGILPYRIYLDFQCNTTLLISNLNIETTVNHGKAPLTREYMDVSVNLGGCGTDKHVITNMKP